MARAENASAGLCLNITLVYSPAPRQVCQWTLALPGGATVAQALAACSVHEDFPEGPLAQLAVGIWGRKASLAHRLHDQDRIEIYRALRVDPKVARRERFNRQGAKSAGLFARVRPGAKAGY
ncbi:MAG: RnfH family protein [Pseudomonadota bacterium]|nr:RnfH family protein [Pseudomonadota bacterium]